MKKKEQVASNFKDTFLPFKKKICIQNKIKLQKKKKIII